MPSRRGFVFSLSLGIALCLAEPAGATIENQKSFKQAYPGKDAKD